MNQTTLEFVITDTDNAITLWDCSLYNPDLPITGETLQIIPPNFSTAYQNSYSSTGRTVVTGNYFGWGACDLVDGHYQITVSVCPNDLVFKKINYLRVHNLRKKMLNLATEPCANLHDILYLEVAKSLINKGDTESIAKGVLIFNSLNSKY